MGPVKRRKAYLDEQKCSSASNMEYLFKFQELSSKDYHVYQTQISRTRISDSVKYSGLLRSQHYNFYMALLYSCVLNGAFAYFCILVLWYYITKLTFAVIFLLFFEFLYNFYFTIQDSFDNKKSIYFCHSVIISGTYMELYCGAQFTLFQFTTSA